MGYNGRNCCIDMAFVSVIIHDINLYATEGSTDTALYVLPSNVLLENKYNNNLWILLD